MWKVKEFINEPFYIDKMINQFIEQNEIEEFEISGYEVRWYEDDKEFYTFVLMKYWIDYQKEKEC